MGDCIWYDPLSGQTKHTYGLAAGSSKSKPAWFTMNGMTYLPQQELTYAQTVPMVTEPGARNN